jgi:putative transposase
MTFPPEVLDQLLRGYTKPEDLTGPNGLLDRLTAALIERAIGAHPSQDVHCDELVAAKPTRMHDGNLGMALAPRVAHERQHPLGGFDDKIRSMYARGIGAPEISTYFAELYGVSVDAHLIRRVTDAVGDEFHAWQHRALAPLYLIVFLDKLSVKIHQDGALRIKTVFIAVGVGLSGAKEVLGTWIPEPDGPHVVLSILHDMRRRGLSDILIICAEGPSDRIQNAAAIFRGSVFQTCIMHIVRSSVHYASCKDRRAVLADLRQLYTAETNEAAEHALDEFERRWAPQYRNIASTWRRRWQEILPILELPPEIRRAIYMTNAVEVLRGKLRKAVRAAGTMPSNDAALNLLFIAIRSAQTMWGRPFPQWNRCGAQFARHFGDRIAGAMPQHSTVNGAASPLCSG